MRRPQHGPSPRSRSAKRASPAQATAGMPTTRHPGRVVFRDEDAHGLGQARRQMADEVAALRAARHEPESDRRRLLSDLASRLDALVASLADAPSLCGQRAALGRLAAGSATATSPRRRAAQSSTRSGMRPSRNWPPSRKDTRRPRKDPRAGISDSGRGRPDSCASPLRRIHSWQPVLPTTRCLRCPLHDPRRPGPGLI